MRLPLCLALLASASAHAALELPAIFSDHAVLQQGQAVPVWGWADAGTEVSVSIADQSVKATTNAKGQWRADLSKLEAKGPQTLTITSGSETKTVQDVLIGEVWLGSGQSNMAMTVSRAMNYEKEQAEAKLPEIRMFVVKSHANTQQQERCEGAWVVCSPETVGGFSATAYFFGKEIHRELGVPVGLINSSVGGTPIESWISPEVQKASAELKPFFEMGSKADAAFDPVKAKADHEKQLARWRENSKKAKAEGKPAPRAPRNPLVVRERKGNVGGLFNGKIAPLIPYAIRGALWYQGEANSNGEKANFYQHQLPLLVKDWRTRWGYEFPMAWVQLPNFSANRGEGWMLVREAMLKSVQNVTKSGMAVTLDIGEAKDIHPKNKQMVGHRLAQWALATVYEKPNASSGPLPVKHEVKGSEIIVTFDHVANGLELKSATTSGFVIAGEDKAWHPAEARVEGNSVILSSKAVPAPLAARYAWAELPDVTLWNSAGLPATQFRTDTW
ncbi:sialate O-acetylesterase [Brevifollis gellanilyticus]|uniref:9-O-acetylesterase n=1 Tax=Brevifollis gellanilyticus TaxID=748831 RepID=A0A512M9E9_9BACT|nr:sialate O-acetylesterase [Brevifollis gellanilyticus]GEP43356.1 9-O-acetylesterase [Brevifollis gellanilyticus]